MPDRRDAAMQIVLRDVRDVHAGCRGHEDVLQNGMTVVDPGPPVTTAGPHQNLGIAFL
jgi:hypothetical protein